jgi:phage terminase small subunit
MYGYLGVAPLTTQQELFVLSHLRGMSIRASEQAAGMSRGTGNALMRKEGVVKIKEFFRQQMFDACMIDVDMLNNMALEAHRKSANATEELKAVETLAKLNQLGGFAPALVIKERVEKSNEKEVGPKSSKMLESMSQDQLLKMANFDGLDDLAPTPVTRDEPQSSGDEPIEGELLEESP